MILDTNALSAIAEGDSSATKLFIHDNEAALPVIVIGEYRFGISQSRHKREYENWLSETIAACRVLDVTQQTASWYAHVCTQLKQAGKPIPSNDAWIAALARQHSLPVLSRDRHFDWIKELKRVSW